MVENKLTELFEEDLNKIVGGDGFKECLEDFGKGLVNGVASILIVEYSWIMGCETCNLPYDGLSNNSFASISGRIIGRQGTLLVGSGALIAAGAVACKVIQGINKLKK